MSHKSGLAPMGSLFRVSPGWNQGVGCAGSSLDYPGKNMLSSSFRLLVKFLPCGWRVEVLCFLAWCQVEASLSSRPLISFSCVSFIFMPAMVHQMPLCFESTWISLLLLVREYSAFKGFTWLGQVYPDCLCILRSTDRELKLSAISLPLDPCLIGKQKDRNLRKVIFRIPSSLVSLGMMSIDDSNFWPVFVYARRGLKLSLEADGRNCLTALYQKTEFISSLLRGQRRVVKWGLDGEEREGLRQMAVKLMSLRIRVFPVRMAAIKIYKQ